MRLTLIRHGITNWNVQTRYQGWSDVPLAPAGITDAKLLKERFVEQNIHGVISSDLSRCTDTARIIFPNHMIRTTPELRELSFGDWEGLTYQECLARDRKEYSQWLDNPLTVVPPKGESFAAFRERIHGVVDSLFAEYGTSDRSSRDGRNEHLAIITHGGPIRLILQYLLTEQSEATAFHSIEIPHVQPCGFVRIDLNTVTQKGTLVTKE